MLEIVNELNLQVDGHKLWQEYLGYKSFVTGLPSQSLSVAAQVMHCPENRETMAVAYPIISSILARIAVLPASSRKIIFQYEKN